MEAIREKKPQDSIFQNAKDPAPDKQNDSLLDADESEEDIDKYLFGQYKDLEDIDETQTPHAERIVKSLT